MLPNLSDSVWAAFFRIDTDIGKFESTVGFEYAQDLRTQSLRKTNSIPKSYIESGEPDG